MNNEEANNLNQGRYTQGYGSMGTLDEEPREY